MADDALDFTASEKDMGKAVGDDFREGKVTLPIILAFAAGDEAEQAFWRRTIEKVDQRDGDLDQALAYLAQHKAIDQTLNAAKQAGKWQKERWTHLQKACLKSS